MEYVFGIGIVVLALGLIWLIGTLKTQKHMRTLGVDEAAMQQFEQEWYSNSTRVFGNVSITDNWVANKTGSGLELFPLSEVEFFRKDYISTRYDTTFYVILRFKDCKEYSLPCMFFEQQDDMMALLTERCPQANTRDFGTYL